MEKRKKLKSFAQKALSKIIPPDRIEKTLERERKKGRTVASLNGSFDLLHAGHLQIIYEASLQADVLVVALNSDASVKAYKGAKRPIIALRQRLQMVSALEFVDYATWFEEKNPTAVLKKIKPDVHVNGAEYTENCVEAAVLKKMSSRLHLFKRIPALSTSEIIARAKKCD